MKPWVLMAALAAVLAAPAPLAAQVIDVYVDAVKGQDVTGDGSSGTPYRTMTRAVQDSGSWPVVTRIHVAPGRYDEPLGESFPIQLERDTEVLGSGAHQTIVSGSGAGELIRLAWNSLVSDVTFENAGTGIASPGSCNTSSGTTRFVRRCVVRDCDVGVHLIDCNYSDHGVAFVSSIVHDCGIGLLGESTGWDYQSVTVILYGSTVTRNGIGVEQAGPGERYVKVFDSIVAGNGDDTIDGWYYDNYVVESSVLGDPTWIGVDGNVGIDPELFAPDAGDLHLESTSAVVDLPGPAPDWPPRAAWVSTSWWIWETSYADVGDLDGDARLVGAATDAGADELAIPTIWARGPAQLGATLTIGAQSDPLDALFVFWSAALFDEPLLGLVWLAPPWFPLSIVGTDTQGTGLATTQLPSLALLAGLEVHVQAIRAIGPSLELEGTKPRTLRLLP